MENLGFGLGLRSKHYERILSAPVHARWFEALTENYLGMEGLSGGEPLKKLLRIREKFPVVLHGVSLSIASHDPLNKKYLHRLKSLQQQVEPSWISDHLCWTGLRGENLHDLLPFPYTEELLLHVSSKIEEVQNYLGRPLVLENVSAYLEFASSEMRESEFLARLAQKTGCKLLLDVNNIFVSSVNFGHNASTFMRDLPKDSVQQIHLAGHSRKDSYLIDTHSAPVCEEVWELYRESVRLFGPVSTMVEWDENIPSYEVLEKEMLRAVQEQSIVLEGEDVLAERSEQL